MVGLGTVIADVGARMFTRWLGKRMRLKMASIGFGDTADWRCRGMLVGCGHV